MNRKFYAFVFIATLLTISSCKKNDASSKIDENATSIAPANPEEQGNIEPNIGGPEEKTTSVATPKDGKYPEMSFKENEFNFGEIKQGDKVTHEFSFTNTGKADLVITDAKGSCGCTVPEYPKEPIAPGENGTIKVSFNSAGKSGDQSKTVTLMCNTQKGSEILTIKSTVNAPDSAKK